MSNQLIQAQRYEIYLGLKRKWSKSKIAREIGVSVSTVSREVSRNSNTNGDYVWLNAQRKCDSRRHGLKGNHRKPAELWWRIDQMIIEDDWSPAQIAGVLQNEGIHIVKQTIYNHVHADASGKLAAHMPHELKYTRRMRKIHITKASNIATVQAYMNVRQRLTVNDLGIGRWIPLWIHMAMPYLRLRSDRRTSYSWRGCLREGRPYPQHRLSADCCFHTGTMSEL